MSRIDTNQDIELPGDPAATGCSHGDAVRVARPSAPGCDGRPSFYVAVELTRGDQGQWRASARIDHSEYHHD